MKVYGICVLAITVTQFAAAQGGSEPWKTNTTPRDEVNLVASLSGFPSDGNPISGTNVNFTVGALLGADVGQTPYHGWTHGRVKKIVIRVGLGEGEVIKEWTNEGELVELGTPERLGTLEKAFAVRFASTHFPHDSVVNFKVHAEASLRDGAGVTADLVVDVEGNQRAYNRGLFLATQETYQNNQYVIDPGGIAAGLAKDCVDVARPRVQGMEHVVEPATSSEAQN